MILILLGLLDFLAGIVLFLLRFLELPTFGIFFGAYVILKGIIFFRNVVSLMDIFAGVFILLAVNGVYNNFTWIFILWLLQKGFFSLIPQ